MNMKLRTSIPMSEHREMGESIKRAEKAIDDVLRHSYRFYATETDKLIRANRNLGLIKSRLEDVMFKEHPYLTNSEGFAVYYGDEAE